jgi:high-affinity iron transporter
VAAVSVLTLTVHMWRAGRHIKGDIEGHLKTSAARAGLGALAGVFLFTLLMIGREGVETALLLMQLHATPNLVGGAALGVLAAAGVAWIWSRFGHRLNLGLFFQTTAIFLFVFVVQLLIQGVHETAEQGYLPFSAPIHAATEAWGPDSGFGHLLTYLLVLLPLTWLLFKGLLFSSKPHKPHVADA